VKTPACVFPERGRGLWRCRPVGYTRARDRPRHSHPEAGQGRVRQAEVISAPGMTCLFPQRPSLARLMMNQSLEGWLQSWPKESALKTNATRTPVGAGKEDGNCLKRSVGLRNRFRAKQACDRTAYVTPAALPLRFSIPHLEAGLPEHWPEGYEEELPSQLKSVPVPATPEPEPVPAPVQSSRLHRTHPRQHRCRGTSMRTDTICYIYFSVPSPAPDFHFQKGDPKDPCCQSPRHPRWHRSPRPRHT
jgi:hypothetical protein